MKRLSLEDIRRAVGSGGNGTGGGGSSSFNPAALAGFARESWVDEQYVSKAYFNQMFRLHGTKTTTRSDAQPGDDPVVEPYTFQPNELPGTTSYVEEGVTFTVTTAVKNIEFVKGSWTESFLSALGLNSSGGGGGGASLNEPLSTINNANLGTPSSANSFIVWNGTNYVWRIINSGTVTSVGVAPVNNSHLTVSGSPIDSSGTINIGVESGRSIPTDASQSNWDTAYGWGNHASAGYALASQLLDYLPLTGGTLTGGLYIVGQYGYNLFVDSSATLTGIGFYLHGDRCGGIFMDAVNGSLKRSNSYYASYTIWDSGNDGSGSGLDADLLDGYHAAISNTPFGNIPVIASDGRIELGSGIEFHYDNTKGLDYTTRILLSNNPETISGANTLVLPSGTGTLALTSDLSGYLPLTGGTLTGGLYISGQYGFNLFVDSSATLSGMMFYLHGDRCGGIGLDAVSGSLKHYNANYIAYKIWDEYNDGSGSGLDADLLDGYHAGISNTPFGMIPVVSSWGTIELGSGIEFHFDNTTGSDYSTRILCPGNYSNTLTLPTTSGTLATQEYVATNYYTKEQADARFITISFFETLFNALNSSGQKVNANTTSGIASIKAMFGFWTDQYLSALGLNPSGGGGGGATALKDLTDVSSTLSPTTGQFLRYNGSKWDAYTLQLATGTVTSVGITVPTGFSVTGSPITTNGTFAIGFASGYSLPLTADTNKGVTAYGWGNHANAGYALASQLNNYLPLTGGELTGVLTLRGSNLNLGTSGTSSNDSSDIQWLYGNGNEKARLWVPDSPTAAVGPNWRIYNASGTLLAQTQLAMITDNVASASRLAGTAAHTAWGQTYWSNGVPSDISGAMSSVSSIDSLLYFDTANSRVGIGTASPSYNFHCIGNAGFSSAVNVGGSITAVGNIVSSFGDIITQGGNVYVQEDTNGAFIEIGAIRLIYDSTNNAIKVQKRDGTAANLYTMGGLSALGFSNTVGGLSLADLTVTNSLTSAGLIMTGNITTYGSNNVIINTSGQATFNNRVTSPRFYFNSTHYLYLSGNNLMYYNGTTSIQIA